MQIVHVSHLGSYVSFSCETSVGALKFGITSSLIWIRARGDSNFPLVLLTVFFDSFLLLFFISSTPDNLASSDGRSSMSTLTEGSDARLGPDGKQLRDPSYNFPPALWRLHRCI